MKNVAIIILIVFLAGLSLYLYLGLMECKNMATGLAADLGTRLEQCGGNLEQCMTQINNCQQTLIELETICAPYLLQEFEESEETEE